MKLLFRTPKYAVISLTQGETDLLLRPIDYSGMLARAEAAHPGFLARLRFVVPTSMTGCVCFLKEQEVRVICSLEPAHPVDDAFRALLKLAPVEVAPIEVANAASEVAAVAA